MIITDDNLKQFAIESYIHTHCLSMDEFKSDFVKIIRINRTIELFIKNRDKGSSVRFLLNNFICLLNVFDQKSLIRMLCYRTKDRYMPILITVLDFLSVLPLSVPEKELSNYEFDDDLKMKLKSLNTN
jgi:hypothetical protein